jgi:hypothetical protein
MLPRRFTEADAGPLAALYGDPRVMRFITLQPPSLAKVESEILPEYLREYRPDFYRISVHCLDGPRGGRRRGAGGLRGSGRR